MYFYLQILLTWGGGAIGTPTTPEKCSKFLIEGVFLRKHK
jgi:hypothetical protein